MALLLYQSNRDNTTTTTVYVSSATANSTSVARGKKERGEERESLSWQAAVRGERALFSSMRGKIGMCQKQTRNRNLYGKTCFRALQVAVSNKMHKNGNIEIFWFYFDITRLEFCLGLIPSVV